MACKEDPRCVSAKPYPCLNCSDTYLPCGGDCKPFVKRDATNVAGNKKWLNCCTYCIKTKSFAKVENEYLKSTRYNDPHYLKTGTGCIVNIENKYLKGEKEKRQGYKQACDEHKKVLQALKKLDKEELLVLKGKANKAQIRRHFKEQRDILKPKEKKEKEIMKNVEHLEKKQKMSEKTAKKDMKMRKEAEDMKKFKVRKWKRKDDEFEEKREKKKRKYEEKKADEAEKLQEEEDKAELQRVDKQLQKQESEEKKDMRKNQTEEQKEDDEEQKRTEKLERKQEKLEQHERQEMEIMEKKLRKQEKYEKQDIEKLQKLLEKMEREEQYELDNIQKKLKIEQKRGVAKIQKISKKNMKQDKQRKWKDLKELKGQKRNFNATKKTQKNQYPKNKKFEISPNKYKAKKTTDKGNRKFKKKIMKVHKGNRTTGNKVENKEPDDDEEEEIKGVCQTGSEAATNKKNKFICKCKKRILFTPQCTNTTCVGIIPSPIEGTLNKIYCVCKKVSMKLLGNRQVCVGGQCQRARVSHRDNFVCNYLPQVKCEKSTCEITKFKQLNQAVHAKYEGKCKCILKCKKIELQDQIDQTGEPAFEVQVRRGVHEIANLEVRENVKNLGKSRIPCTCPTFNKHLQHSIKNVCPTGACGKALDIKSISINCKCESRKSKFCTEKTCDLKDVKPLAQRGRIIERSMKRFSLNVNTDKNSILNSSEIQERLTNYQNEHKYCKIGRWHDSFNIGETDFTYECRSTSDICTDKTCNRCICAKEVDSKHSPTGRKIECIARFCCKQGKSLNKTFNKPGNGAYCWDLCEESNIQKEQMKCEEEPKEEDTKQKLGRKANTKPKAKAEAKAKATLNKEMQTLSKPKAMKKQQSRSKTNASIKEEAEKLTKGKAITEHLSRTKVIVKDEVEKSTKVKAAMKEEAKRSSKAKEVVKEDGEDLHKQKKLKELQMWENEEKLRIEEDLVEGNVSLTSSCLSGLASWIITIIAKLAHIIYTCVRHPQVAIAFVKEKLMNPKLTYGMTKRWGLHLYRSKIIRIKNNIDRSETARMLIDKILTNKFVRLFSPNDRKTHNNLVFRIVRKIQRKEVMYSCKRIFSLTMKKSPSMWFFHLCPDFYAPLLNFLIGCRKVTEALMAIGAIIVRTPCFIVLETFRFLFCCTMYSA